MIICICISFNPLSMYVSTHQFIYLFIYLFQEKAQEDALQRTELERQKMVQNLSDRERRALAAEKRMANQLPDIKDVTKYDN